MGRRADIVRRRLGGGGEMLMAAVMRAANEYANGGDRGAPIVRSHFTAGNAGRYGWPALTPAYRQRKEGTPAKVKERKKAIRAAGRIVPKGAGLPILVLSGALRDAITAGRATVRVAGPGLVVIRWGSGLPKYAKYHHEGTPTMPRRSPIAPNAEDQRQILAAARRYLSAMLKTGSVGVGGLDAGRARIG